MGGGTKVEGPMEPTWSVALNSYYLTDRVVIDAEKGYQWLVFAVVVSNLTQEEQYLSSFRFYYLTPDGDKYSSSWVGRFAVSNILQATTEQDRLDSFRDPNRYRC